MLPGERYVRATARRVRAQVPGVFATIDSMLPRRRPPWGGPLNGQRGRQELVRALMELRPPSAVVETGTYLGESTAFFAAQGKIDVYSCESQYPYYRRARARFRNNPTVKVEHADSRDFLRELSRDVSVPRGNLLFYLDAHWAEDLPLNEEVKIIATAWNDAWILIDDFKVPGDEGYGYDDYGPDARLTLDYLQVPPGWVSLFPTLPSSAETGARRGCVLVAPAEGSAAIRESGQMR